MNITGNQDSSQEGTGQGAGRCTIEGRGPVIARFGEQRIAVGIHGGIRIAVGTDSKLGTRINSATHELFDKYRNW